MASSSLYLASVLSAIGLYLLVRPSPQGRDDRRRGPHPLKMLGVLLGLGGLALIVKGIIDLYGPAGAGESLFYYALFGLIAIIGAVRMITHAKPVYAALYFILVVISSAGLFLLLQAEFMAFALVIVYAGAILITYMFVLMLAQQASETDVDQTAEYDRVPREPAAAVFVGFLMMTILCDALFGGKSGGMAPPMASSMSAVESQWQILDSLPKERNARIRALDPAIESVVEQEDGSAIVVEEGEATATVKYVGEPGLRRMVLPVSLLPDNTDQVGQALVGRFPASLEVAGIILTMAMFGAVVLARRQIELSEDERREAAGLRRLYQDEGDKPRPTTARGSA